MKSKSLRLLAVVPTVSFFSKFPDIHRPITISEPAQSLSLNLLLF